MFSQIGLYALLMRAAFALQIPRQAISSYSNSSTSLNATTSTALGPICCELYAPGVQLNHWYSGHNISVNDGYLVTKYLRYNNTIIPTATITAPPTSTLYASVYLGDLDGPAIIPGVPTDLNGAYYGGAYDATMVESVQENSTMIATQAPFMDFTDFFAFFGNLDSAGICVGTNIFDARRPTYTVSSVAQSWFSKAAEFPFPPDSAMYYSGINYTTFYVSSYDSHVSLQTSTWNQRVVVTDIGDELFAWLTQQSSILSQVPDIISCSPVSAAGAPVLHIPVSFLTASSAVTSTTNAMYFNKATTTSAVPASKTLPIVSNTKTLIANVPSSTTVEVPAEKPSNEPVQFPGSQEAGTSSMASAGSEEQPAQSTTLLEAGASSGQPTSSNTAGAPSNGPSQQSAQLAATQTAAAPSGAPADEPSNNPTQPANTQEASHVASAVGSGIQADQASTAQDGGQRGSSQAESNTRVVQSSAPVAVVIGSATATVLSPNVNPAEITIPSTGDHVVDISASTQLAQAPVTVVAGSSQQTSAASAYAIGSQTLKPGGPAIEVSGTTYSLQELGDVVVNGNTMPISTVAPQSSAPAVPVGIGEVAATPVASDKYIIAGQTLNRGGPAIEISGTTYFLPPSASNAIINGQAASISSIQAPVGPPATVVIGGVTAKPESSGAYYLVADQTLNPGGSAIEISGVTYSLPTSGANIVTNGATSMMGQSNIQSVSAVVFGGATAVPLLAGGYVVGSQVISPGGSAVEISGTVYSLPASGSSIVIDGKTTAIQAITSINALLTLGSQTHTALAGSAVPLVVASQTLIPGGSDVTVSGTVFSLPPDATGNIVVNGQTTSLARGASGGVGLSLGSQGLSFMPLTSGIIVASQTFYPGGSAIVVQGETLSIPVGGTAVVIQSGTSTTTKGLGGYVWQGIASTTSSSASHSTSGVESSSSTARLSGSSTRAGVESSVAVVSTGTESASSAQTSTSDASGQQPASSFKPATMALVVCIFVIVLW